MAQSGPSEQQFLSFLLELYQTLSQAPDPEEHRQSVLEHFRSEFTAANQYPPYQLNDKGRLLLVIHWSIDSLRPGSTGAASASAPGMNQSGTQRFSSAASAPASGVEDQESQLRALEAQQQRLQREALASATLT